MSNVAPKGNQLLLQFSCNVFKIPANLRHNQKVTPALKFTDMEKLEIFLESNGFKRGLNSAGSIEPENK